MCLPNYTICNKPQLRFLGISVNEADSSLRHRQFKWEGAGRAAAKTSIEGVNWMAGKVAC